MNGRSCLHSLLPVLSGACLLRLAPAPCAAAPDLLAHARKVAGVGGRSLYGCALCSPDAAEARLGRAQGDVLRDK